MRKVTLDDLEFNANTSRPGTTIYATELTCRKCGSSLAGRREPPLERRHGNTMVIVERWRCRCGARRRIEREVA